MTGQTNEQAGNVKPDIPGYRLSRVIGQGGMSTVWLGTQLSLGREVAIKVMRPEALADEVSRRRFESEARTIARLEHPHIVGIYEVGRTAASLPWYAMPYLPRGHVGQRDLRADPKRLREILQALLSALAFAHARGVIHRDVKAENVLFDEADRPLLADFGIALRRGHGTRVTMTGLAVGSTAYMAPEQARGHQVDHRADLYSVGVLAWEMLTGELPYKADDALAMAIQHTQNPIPRLPPALRHWQRFMDRALAKSPRKRFGDAQQMRQALDNVPLSRTTGGTRLAALALRATGPLRRLPVVAWVMVALLGAGSLGLSLHKRTPEATTTAADSPAPSLPPPAIVIAPAMHGAAPLSAADQWLERMHGQIAAGRLAAPEGNNATDSLLAAWDSDPRHPQLAASSAELLDAMAAAAVSSIGRNRRADTILLLRAGARLRADTGPAPAAALATYHTRVGKALQTGAEGAAARLDPEAAARFVEYAELAGLPDTTVARLRAQVDAIPDLQSRDPGNLEGMIVLETGDLTLAAFATPVSRAAYARFAEVNGRAPALCRERISLLRVLSPRDWITPGFEQTDDDPVVCVSWEDAVAYAQWLGHRDGQRYRLATAGEAMHLPAASGGQIVSEWRRDCVSGCNRRKATGPSWRTDNTARALDPARGYDDVGFRLVREL